MLEKAITHEQQKQNIHPVAKQELKSDHYVSKPQTLCLCGNTWLQPRQVPAEEKNKTLLAMCIVYIYSFKLLVLSLGSTTPKISYKRKLQLFLLKTPPRTNSTMGRHIRKQSYSIPHTEGTARDL